MSSERPPNQEDAREWTAVGEQRGAARAGETMWSGPYLKPGERVVVVAKSRLEAAEAERAREQRMREAVRTYLEGKWGSADLASLAHRQQRINRDEVPLFAALERAGEPPTPDEVERVCAVLWETLVDSTETWAGSRVGSGDGDTYLADGMNWSRLDFEKLARAALDARQEKT